jgi:putative SOS response-associated peptidase YedK
MNIVGGQCQLALMCNRYRMTAKQAELAARFGMSRSTLRKLPAAQAVPKRMRWVVRQDV